MLKIGGILRKKHEFPHHGTVNDEELEALAEQFLAAGLKPAFSLSIDKFADHYKTPDHKKKKDHFHLFVLFMTQILKSCLLRKFNIMSGRSVSWDEAF